MDREMHENNQPPDFFMYNATLIDDGQQSQLSKFKVNEGEYIGSIKKGIKEKGGPKFYSVPPRKIELFTSTQQEAQLNALDKWNPSVTWGTEVQPLIVKLNRPKDSWEYDCKFVRFKTLSQSDLSLKPTITQIPSSLFFIYDLATVLGNLATVIQNLKSEDCRECAITCMDVLQEARALGWSWEYDACSIVAAYGHLDVLKWARQNGCTWDDDTCSNAARNGHLNVLKWARQKGCPWDENVFICAAKQCHIHIIQ